MKLSFMTWLCPDWEISQILSAARKYGYDGVEIRVECKQRHGIELDSSKKVRQAAKKAFEGAGVEISCLATSLQFAIGDEKKRKDNVETLKKYIDLCLDIGCPYIRVFGGPTPQMEIRGVASYTAQALRKAADYALGTDVEILLETHDDFCSSLRVGEVVKKANHRKINVLWDVMHPFRALETFSCTYENLREYIRHLHIHDGRYINEETKIDSCFLGDGVIDHRVPMQFLKDAGFRGHFSLEIIGKKEAEKWLGQYGKKFRQYEKELE